MLPNKTALKLIRKYITIFKEQRDIEEFKEELINNLINNRMLVKTDDGTYTLVSEEKDELMHSRIGALTESVEKFVIPSNLKDMDNPKILDLCSGMGYNTIAALHFNKNCNIDMVEYSEETLFLSLCLNIPYKEHELIKELIKDYFLKNNNYNNNKNNLNRTNNVGACSKNDKITLYLGDARKIVKNLNKTYNIVFHDAFSPQRDAVLYTVDFLKEIYKKMDNNSVLISYSSSIPFRSALVEVGFVLSEGAPIGRKRGITLAYKNPSLDRDLKRISEVDERLIALSTVGVPYRDDNLNLDHDAIVINRENERKKLKEELSKINKYYSTKKVKLGKIDEKFLNIQKLDLNSSEIIKKMKEELKN
ncbi:MnmC family methyltransferase [Methanothermococcus okinawensis]|uniref:MnmC-like methyltransferase domain-containing protein n=1 Tax=Methanothermococcus okinawensis (strain DSM 14208 / JCM 11175 / IH1) TaxID=647113 RepID=F8AN65_METOI|nr:MnmC family methyltransferase [Methanothermococcus okinawensis]AEH06981.1 protein of unknown function DUF752 [Methanothermococcus okinawensis IH1]